MCAHYRAEALLKFCLLQSGFDIRTPMMHGGVASSDLIGFILSFDNDPIKQFNIYNRNKQ